MFHSLHRHKIPDLNLLGRNAIQALGISVDSALGLKSIESQIKSEGARVPHPTTSSATYASLQKDCHALCDELPDLFKDELGCLKDFELEVKFVTCQDWFPSLFMMT